MRHSEARVILRFTRMISLRAPSSFIAHDSLERMLVLYQAEAMHAMTYTSLARNNFQVHHDEC